MNEACPPGVHRTVVRDLNPSLPPLALDEFKIQQVFIDLFTNALQAMGADGVLTLRTFRTTQAQAESAGRRRTDRFTPHESVAVVQIDDTGPGILAEHLGKVFDPFFTTKPTGLGTGLGLSVSRQIVQMHGGSIEIGNRDEGGARVTVTFKLDNGATV